MASDVAQFLKQNFLNSFQEIESSLPSCLKSEFRKIKVEFIDDRDDKNQKLWLIPPFESISLLQELNDALACCNNFLQQNRVFKRKLFLLSRPANCKFVSEMKNQLSSIKNRLCNLSTRSLTPSSFPTGRHTEFGADTSKAVTCKDYEKKMLDWLALPGFRTIGIYGMFGSGKTTLVKKILNNAKVVEKFKNIAWVCLSDMTSKEELHVNIIKYLLEEKFEFDVDAYAGNKSNDWIVEQLKLKLESHKRYLIVLDDVWHCNVWFNNLHEKMGDGHTIGDRFTYALPKHTGCAVIVTTRLKEVAKQMVGERNLIHLEPWDNKNLEAIMKETQVAPKMVDEVIRHSHGLPFAAKTLANVAKDKPEGEREDNTSKGNDGEDGKSGEGA